METLESEFPPTSANHDEVNAFVQNVQRDAQSWHVETRSVMSGQKHLFQVYYGEWYTLASEIPFVKDPYREGTIASDIWSILQAQMARDIGR